MPRALIDTGIWYALCDKSEPRPDRESAARIHSNLSRHEVIVPWPVVYETLGTKFTKNRPALACFDRALRGDRVARLRRRLPQAPDRDGRSLSMRIAPFGHADCL